MSDAVAKKAHVWERDEFDWYVEPERVTQQLLTVERFSGGIHDPACGQGNIVKTLRAAGYHATGSDIVDRVDWPIESAWYQGEVDFLANPPWSSLNNIVTNPPFFRAKGAEAFIRKALSIATGKVAVFVDIRFLAGAERAGGLFEKHPPHRVWIVTPRASCPPGTYLAAGNKAGNGSSDWCWLVWDQTAPFFGTQLGWLRGEKA